MKPVEFTPGGKAEFLEILNFIRQDNPSAAKAFRSRVLKNLRRLEKFPESGRVLPEFPERRYREVVVGAYRFFYRIEGERVWVVRALRGSRLPREPE